MSEQERHRLPGETPALWIGCCFLAILPIAHTVALRYLALVTLIGLAAYLAWRRHPPLSILTPILAPLVAWTLYAALSLLWTIDFAYSESEFRAEVLYPTLAFLAFFVLTRTAVAYRLLVRTFALAGGGVALYAIGLYLVSGAWGVRETLGVGDVGAYSTWATLALPVCVALALEKDQPSLPSVLAWSIVALILAAAALTQNRALWLALAAALSVYWALQPNVAGSGAAQRYRKTLTLITLTCALMAVAFFATHREKAARLALDDAALVFVTSDTRQQIWTHALLRISERPLLGYGYGRGILRQDFRQSMGNKLLWHGHNLFLNVTLSLGLLGLALLLWLLWALGRAFWQRRDDPATRALGLALLAGILVKNQFDDLMVRENALLFWSLMALLLGGSQAKDRDQAAYHGDEVHKPS
jgi:O-antigen ligase